MNHAVKFLMGLATLLLATVTHTVFAQNTFELDDLDDGEVLLNLNATEQMTVEQDTLNINMQYATQGRDSVAVQNEVNKALREAGKILEETDNIDYSIQQYHVYMLSDGQRRKDLDNPVWRAQQGLQMTSSNSAALLVVTARLQEAGLTISNMRYSLSNEKYEEVADSLLEKALEKLQARAERVAKALKKDDAELVEVSINDHQNVFGGRVMRAEAMVSDSAAMNVPVADPGESQVSLTVTARALLSP